MNVRATDAQGSFYDATRMSISIHTKSDQNIIVDACKGIHTTIARRFSKISGVAQAFL